MGLGKTLGEDSQSRREGCLDSAPRGEAEGWEPQPGVPSEGQEEMCHFPPCSPELGCRMLKGGQSACVCACVLPPKVVLCLSGIVFPWGDDSQRAPVSSAPLLAVQERVRACAYLCLVCDPGDIIAANSWLCWVWLSATWGFLAEPLGTQTWGRGGQSSWGHEPG